MLDCLVSTHPVICKQQFEWFPKNLFGAYGMPHAAIAARGIGVMQQAALSPYIIYRYLQSNTFAWRPKWRGALMSIAYATKGISCNSNFLKLIFG
jgi:hypothetical protein